VNFPDDDDGDELRLIAEGGSDMALPMPVEFTVVFPERKEADSFSGLVASLGWQITPTWSGQVNVLGNSALMFQFSADFK